MHRAAILRSRRGVAERTVPHRCFHAVGPAPTGRVGKGTVAARVLPNSANGTALDRRSAAALMKAIEDICVDLRHCAVERELLGTPHNPEGNP